ncbi:hypothetical protein Ae201684P_021434 [Aphanomyces euteiches]|nr:hypothetical protein Ae201684P_021434 [Aphanomyces euteiches]
MFRQAAGCGADHLVRRSKANAQFLLGLGAGITQGNDGSTRSYLVAVYVHYGTKPADHVFPEADSLRAHGEVRLLVRLEQKHRGAIGVGIRRGIERAELDLVTMCPTWILGPMLQPELNESSKTIYDYVCGNIQEIPRGDKAIVDVRDGAHRCVREPASVWSLLSCCSPEDAPPLLYSCVKAEHEMGIRFRSAEEMIHATCDSLVKHRFAS